MTTYSKFIATGQMRPLAGREDRMLPNHAGGYAFAVSPWTRLERFLILGTAGGTFYVQPRAHTQQDGLAVLDACLAVDPFRVLATLRQVVEQQRAIKDEPGILTLAYCLTHTQDVRVRDMAWRMLPFVCRIPTHLFHFMQYYKYFGGPSNRRMRTAIEAWYQGRGSYHLVKYQQRDGWSHKDMLRLAHPSPTSEEESALWRWVMTDEEGCPDALVQAHCFVHTHADDLPVIIEAIRAHQMTHEMLPSQALAHREIWEALLPHMPLTACLRNLGRMTHLDVFANSEHIDRVVSKITDTTALRRARIHPLAVLTALRVYRVGHAIRGELSWDPHPVIISALDTALGYSFGSVEPTGVRLCLALDVSGSMSAEFSDSSPISCKEAVVVLALVALKREPIPPVLLAFSHHIVPIDLTADMSFAQALDVVNGIPYGATDCALPMLALLKQQRPVDAFCVYTDNETWAGLVHPMVALERYRHQMGLDAGLVVTGMTATQFSIADPQDVRCLDVVGFDIPAAQAITTFIQGLRLASAA